MVGKVLPAAMPAWTCRRYGGPETLELERIPLPRIGSNTVLLRMLATTVSSGDARLRGCRFPPGMHFFGRLALGWNGPRRPVLGTELVGEVAAVGSGVTRYNPGDRVIAFPDTSMGAHAGFVAMEEGGLIVPCPPGMPLERAASLSFGGMTALHYLRRAEIQPGERLLVIGASGTVGSAMVQLARIAGAHVTAVCSTGNVPIVAPLGADRVIDYQREDFHALGEQWDVIADCAAASDFRRVLPVLRPGGRYLPIAGGLRDMLARPRKGRRSIAGPAASNPAMLAHLAGLAQQGEFVPLIESIHAFADMQQAHRIADSGRKRGAVVVLGPE